MTADATSSKNVPLSQLPAEEKAVRASTFGSAASHYERYRPGPPLDAVEWILGDRRGYVVDLGAGTGALTRLLTAICEEVVAVEPDDRMRAVLSEEVPGARALKGRGESIPVEDGVARGGLGVVVLALDGSDPDPEGGRPCSRARGSARGDLVRTGSRRCLPRPGESADRTAVCNGFRCRRRDSETLLAGASPGLIMSDADRPNSTLEIPGGVGFGQPENTSFTWDIALTADDLVGLLGTFSWFLTMPADAQHGVATEARRLLREFLGVEGDVTIDVAFRCEAWRSYGDS